MADEHYNGWTNYPTWNVALWIDNEQGSQEEWKEHARTCYQDAKPTDYSTRVQIATRDLSRMLKDEFEEASPVKSYASMWNDIMGWALEQVNWQEIAGNMIEDVYQEIDRQEAQEAADAEHEDDE